MARTAKGSDNYLSRVLKHIPSEIVMTYVAIDGVLQTTYSPSVPQDREMLLKLLWIVFFGGHRPAPLHADCAHHHRPVFKVSKPTSARCSTRCR